MNEPPNIRTTAEAGFFNPGKHGSSGFAIFTAA
jgi:hypothetical protein